MKKCSTTSSMGTKSGESPAPLRTEIDGLSSIVHRRPLGSLKPMRILMGLGVFLLIFAPSPALAHDNLGGDELSLVNWILIFAMVLVALGLLAGLWAVRSGQFSNIEESKYRMLDTAEDFDAVMAEADERTRAARPQKQTRGELPMKGTPAERSQARATQAKL